VDRTSHRLIETPNDNLDKRPSIQHVTFVH
jgi:hypothetical protein